MPELSDLLHRSVDDLAVPHPPAYDIVERGRGLRRKRRIATGVVAVAAVIAAGVGGVLVTDLGNGGRADSHVAGQDETGGAMAAYRKDGAFAVGKDLTIGTTTVTLDAAPRYLAQTSVGVVAQLPDDATGTSAYVLVAPNGTQTGLAIPDDVVHVDGDINAPRVAWVEPQDGALVSHVWDVVTNQEVGGTAQPSQGTKAGEAQPFIRVVALDGPRLYYATDDDKAIEENWSKGGVKSLPERPLSVHNGVAAVQVGENWLYRELADIASPDDAKELGSSRTRSVPLLAPDGRSAYVSLDVDGSSEAWGFVAVGGDTFTPATGGAGITPNAIASWTPGGRLIATGDEQGELVRCDRSGACTAANLELPPDVYDVLLADYLIAG